MGLRFRKRKKNHEETKGRRREEINRKDAKNAKENRKGRKRKGYE